MSELDTLLPPAGKIEHLALTPVAPVVLDHETPPVVAPIETNPDPVVETDPTILAAQADADGNLPNATPATEVTPEQNGYVQTDVTLEGLFTATQSEEGIPEAMGLSVINALNQAFGGEDLPRATEMATQYMEGREASATLSRLQLISDALPTYDRYAEVMTFAEGDDTAKAEFNKARGEAKTVEDLTVALRQLNSRFEAYHGGQSGTPVQGGVAPATPAIELIGTRSEYNELVADPRHETDATYRRGLRNRLMASIASGKYNSEA